MERTHNIGLFFGSDTGYTEGVATQMVALLGASQVDLHNIRSAKAEDFAPYDQLIIGLSTWHDGQLQSDWDTFYETFKTIDFTAKTVALFGLGDQVGYAEYFVDGIGILGDVVYENGGHIIGVWPADTYEYESSKAEFEPGWLLGLALDEDNQPDLTVERVQLWIQQIQEEFKEAALQAKKP